MNVTGKRPARRTLRNFRGLFNARVWLTAMLVLAATGQPAPAVELNRLLARSGFAVEDVGYVLFDPVNGGVIAAHQPDLPHIPASTTKIVTLIAALKILGENYRFETSVSTTGEITDGALHGNVYLRGGGDPTLTTDDLRAFVAALHQAGIVRMSGSFIFDDSFLARSPQIDARQPIAASYNPGLSALSVNYNRILLRWKRKPDVAAFLTTVLSPAAGGNLPVETMSIGLLPNDFDRRIKFLYRNGGTTDHWLLSPSLSARGQEELPVKADPGQMTALLLQALCRQHGITLPAPQRGLTPSTAQVLHSHHSEALSEIVPGVLHYSNNLAAELIGQVAARKLSGRPLSLPASATTLVDWYHRILPKEDWSGFLSANHSGLSNASRHTPRQLAAILHYGWTLQVGDKQFFWLLPGLSWSPKDRHAETRVRAKSGTMSYTDGLAGFLTAASGRQLGFVVLITDFLKRAAFDATLEVRIADPPPAARAWTQRAKELERVLVTDWITRH